jgi:polysaccharide export outer membrane protein
MSRAHGSGVSAPWCAGRYITAALLAIATTLGLAPAISHAADAAAGIPAYRISAEDVLDISVWKEEDLVREVIVRPDGGISFPLAGDLQAAGLTTGELERALTERLARYIPDAVVSVSVKELKGLRLYVTGKVGKPGQYQVGRYIDVLQAITLAGGLTPFAKADEIRVLRRENGREVVYEFNHDEVEAGKNLSQNILLQTDDVVVVP